MASWHRMKRSLCFVAVSLAIALASCNGLPLRPAKPSPTSPPDFDRDSESYRVYVSALASWCRKGRIALDPNSPSFSVNPSWPGGPDGYDYLSGEFRRVFSRDRLTPINFERSTYNDYVRATGVDLFVLNRNFDFGRRVDFMSKPEFMTLVDEAGGFDEFNEANPTHCGHVELSRVGFDDTGKQALVHIAAIGGGEWCIGQYLLLLNVDNEWKIVTNALQWIC